jgi:4-azaleucine resistance transporter AzlC
VDNNRTLTIAFRATIPVLLGYTAIGLAFGLLLYEAGLPLYFAPLMSIFIYAGSGQFIGIGLLAAGAGYFEIASITLLINARHAVYGISVRDIFAKTGRAKPYMIFSLTDETYALLTTLKPPGDIDTPRFYFFIALLNHCYWVTASILGFLIGRIIPVSTEGLDFALTALFVVLLIEQWKNCKVKLPFFIAAGCAVPAMFLLQQNTMLIVSIMAAIGIVLLLKKVIERYGPN